MIYTTGAVSTVSGSAIVKGSGTKFKNNNPAINIGMTILIKSGNTNIPYMIKSVNSDTELVLAHPALATVNNTPFSIHITEPDNNSDAARTMVAINAYTQYFLDAMNTWMSETGQTKIEMPNGETITLDSIKKMQGDIKGKADLNSGNVQRFKSGLLAEPSIGAAKGDMRLLIDLKADKFEFIYTNGSGWFGNQLPGKNGTLMVVGDYGLGIINSPSILTYIDNANSTKLPNGIYAELTDNIGLGDSAPYGIGGQSVGVVNVGMHITRSNDFRSQLATSYSGSGRLFFRGSLSEEWASWREVWHNYNTTVDPQGFIKRASPIIDIYPDGTFTTNDESEGATVTRVTQGEYLIEGVLGFNSDAGWGGVDGGIEIPLDVNKQPLIWVNSKINSDGSILVKTYHRTHPDAPSFANNEIEDFKNGDPIDIPDGRFISVRVQMPEQSIYNVRMREMEEVQKAEEERRQKEEEMKAQFGLGENEILL
ncbi:pyocin knob domain-containing protein [Proteus sp. FME41]|uniref:pyocin knob domain-containing protein n=1 Tax=Proteus sp. FME41 TaxID=2742608 RepID=UPI00186775CE|nr:pyocin knob domain-containing protein [Proteus sp. FME41]